MQITIQKKFLILYEIAENVYAMFLVIVNFVFEFASQSVEVVKREFNNFVEKTHNFIRALFGFNIYKLKSIKIETKTNSKNISFKNNDFLIYSNLLAPPVL